MPHGYSIDDAGRLQVEPGYLAPIDGTDIRVGDFVRCRMPDGHVDYRHIHRESTALDLFSGWWYAGKEAGGGCIVPVNRGWYFERVDPAVAKEILGDDYLRR